MTKLCFLPSSKRRLKTWLRFKYQIKNNGPLSKFLSEDDTSDKPVQLANVNAEVLKKIIEWAEHHQDDEIEDEDGQPKAKRVVYLQEWDIKYFKIDQQMIFEIIMASNYLGMIKLLDMACKTIADMIKDKTPEEVRQTFNIPNDLEDPQSA
ncbi:unnamed protein product [Adineta ricciae]|uniref:Uncharacterized protein n=2 Tax=Adineta ricciae TaxID=249248 RepID=A0A815PBZ9_ADIRI|nr:unnamed protein product [Adineta ricciae]